LKHWGGGAGACGFLPESQEGLKRSRVELLKAFPFS